MRVSDIFVAVEFVVVAARVLVAPRGDVVVAERDATAPVRPGKIAVRVRVADSDRGAVTDKVPARVATIFCARVCVVPRCAVVFWARDCVGAVLRAVAVNEVPSRTAAYAGAPAKKPRIAPKIRIFFISEINVSKICKSGAREK